MLRRLLRYLFLDKRARQSLDVPVAVPKRRMRVAAPKPERTPADALADAEKRMQRLPPEKAQLIRTAMAVHRAGQASLAGLSDEDHKRLQQVAEKAFLGK
jgi:hypothetical protein